MLRWNDKYGIKFLRLSSEMFPFASHEEYGYKLEPFAAEVLAQVGKVVAELGHRVTTHPGQFTQLGSPRKSVIDGAIRDLTFHDEMLSLLKLPEQANRDAVMILHLGGVFGDKVTALERFRENYKALPQSVKNRLVLENDDVSWSVHELLPVCEELNIPMVLDYHHHNIIFDAEQLREGTADIMNLYPRITATWDRKGIKQKMHYSEPTPAAITKTQRRKHNPRVATLPPCSQDMDLMIEAKDKEQAVFELMRTFKLPGFDTFNDMIPHVRKDDNRAALQAVNKKKATPKKKGKKVEESDEEMEDDGSFVGGEASELVPEEEVGMGGPEGRVYWPPGMEEWLRPKKREVKAKAAGSAKKATPAQKRKALADALSLEAAVKEQHESDEEVAGAATAATKKAKEALKQRAVAARAKSDALQKATAPPGSESASKPAPKRKAAASKVKKEKEEEKVEVTPPSSDDEAVSEPELKSEEEDDEAARPAKRPARAGARSSGRANKVKVSYQEADVSMDEN
jgi:UV DNA damage endonuclease